MRKLTMMVAFAAVAGATAMQAQGNTPPNRPPAGGRGGRGGPGGMGMNQMLLKGITLSDAQKGKLDQLRDAERQKMEAQRGQGRGESFESIREAREKGDTATVRRLMAEQRTLMEARRDEQISAIRAVLSGDQLTQFDANVAEVKKRQSEMGPGRGFGGEGRRGRGVRPPQGAAKP